MKKIELVIDKIWLQKIENILPRLKWAVSPLKIINWLENFEPGDRSSAYDFLLAFEYITFNELLCRLEDQLQAVERQLSPKNKVIIFPYGQFGKSGTLLTYPLRNTPTFKKLGSRVTLTNDPLSLIVTPNTSLIMLDDFIGSANTFIKSYKPIRKWADQNKIQDRILLACITMDEGRTTIHNEFNGEVQIFSEIRYKIFNKHKSPLNILGSLNKLSEINMRYGSCIKCFPKVPFARPLGYDDSESLVSFPYSTPNNTLPIIWADNGWKSLFPRRAYTKMSDARKLKREVAHYIGIMNRLGLDLYEDKSIRIHGKRVRKYNHKKDHSLILLIKLKLEQFDDIAIAHTFGITIAELQNIYQYGRRKGYFDSSYFVTVDGQLFFYRLKRNAGTTRFNKLDNLEKFNMKNITYLPKTFKGVA